MFNHDNHQTKLTLLFEFQECLHVFFASQNPHFFIFFHSLDLRLFDAWKKFQKNILPNGGEKW